MTRRSFKRVWQVDLSDDMKNIMLKTDGYDPAVVAGIKTFLPTPRFWIKSEEAWKLPLLWRTCEKLRELANVNGCELEIGMALRTWALAEKARIASIPDPERLELTGNEKWSGVLERDYPRIWKATENRPFQRVGIQYVATSRAALIADQPGAGKTLQTIGGIVEAGVTGPILIVAAPKSAAVITWPAELAKWAPNDHVVTISSKSNAAQRASIVNDVVKSFESSPKRVWVITSPDYIRMRAETDQYGNYTKPKQLKPVAHACAELHDVTWGAIVADESHKTLACNTLNRKK